MTTRKQKHDVALAKRERFMAEQRQTGLAAQLRAKVRQQELRDAMIAEAQATKRRHNTILATHMIKAGGDRP